MTIKKYSYQLHKGYYEDCFIVKETKLGCTIKLDSGREIEHVPKASLEKPMRPDVNKRFTNYERMCEHFFCKKAKAVIVAGLGGIGKSFTAIQVMERLGYVEEDTVMILKGTTTARGFYDFLKRHWDKPIILDDFDAVWKDKEMLNILKSVLDIGSRSRKVTWNTSAKNGGDDSFRFEGSIMFITNMQVDDLDQALLTRNFVLDLDMTIDEMLVRLHSIIQTVDLNNEDLELTPLQREEVYELIVKYKHTLFDLNLRTLLKGMQLYAMDGDIEATREILLSKKVREKVPALRTKLR